RSLGGRRLGEGRQRIGAEPAQQHLVGRLVLGMVLEAGALEPLGQINLAVGALLHLSFRDRVAEQRQALSCALGLLVAVELQAIARPEAPELRRDRVTSLCEVVRRAGVGLWEGLPIAALSS